MPSRRIGRLHVGASPRAQRAVLLMLGVVFHARTSGAQQRPIPSSATRRDTVVSDTAKPKPVRRIPSSVPDSLLRPPVTPKSAFLHSLVLPGWGQSLLRRSTAATIFSTVEVGSIYMVAKARADLRRARALQGNDSVAVGDPSLGEPVTRIPAMTDGLVNARKLFVEDWLALLIFNHLLSGADAYVAANLWDLPARVSIRYTPNGGSIGARFRW